MHWSLLEGSDLAKTLEEQRSAEDGQGSSSLHHITGCVTQSETGIVDVATIVSWALVATTAYVVKRKKTKRKASTAVAVATDSHYIRENSNDDDDDDDTTRVWTVVQTRNKCHLRADDAPQLF